MQNNLNEKCFSCTGCMACMNICPASAISMVQNDKGFYTITVDDSKCTSCGLCKKVCPQINKNSMNNVLECYASKADDELRQKSSSGGVFSILAEYIFTQGGYVCGASFDEDYKSVSHIIVDNKKDLEKIKTSKYLQSSIGTIFKSIKSLLDTDKLVLFTGTPCQVAGLKNFLQHDYKNLITLDILCHGVPSPKVWKKYVEEISKGEKVVYANFREKKFGWTPSLLLLLLLLKGGKEIKGYSNEDLYYRAFLKNLILNDCCAECSYTSNQRIGDITLGDFWGIEEYDKKIKDDLGVSAVLINSEKGKKIYNEIKNRLCFKKQVPFKFAIKGNLVLEKPCVTHYNRNLFFENLDKLNIIDNLETSLSQKKYEGIITNFWWSHCNYGAVLSAYAIQQWFKQNGYNYKILDYKPSENYSNFSFRFTNRYLDLTHDVQTEEDIITLNSTTDNFVIGTDQVLRYLYTEWNLEKYILSYTDFSKKRIAFSGSFGLDEYNEASEYKTYYVKKAFKRFDAISTREDTGVDICRDVFGINAEYIIDPVLLVDKKIWENLDNKEDYAKTYKGKVVSYILDSSDEIEKGLNFLGEHFAEVKNLAYKELSIEEFVSAIKNCEYFITDSFHGLCFAIIFNKKVACITNKQRGHARFSSLARLFGIKSLFVDSIEEIYSKKDLFEEYDRVKIEEAINIHRAKAREFMHNVLDKPKQITNESISAELDFLNVLKETPIMQNCIPIKKKRFWEKIFSVTNEYSSGRKYKVLMILGIKIKFKSSRK